MAVLGALSFTLEVPEIEPGVKFYTDAGLVATIEGDVARFRCEGQDRDSVVLLGGFPRKRLHHISLRADDLDGIAAKVAENGGKVVPAPAGFEDNGLWVEDANGMLIRLSERPADPELEAGEPYQINAPGRVVRKRRSAVLPQSKYPPAKPLRLGHILVFSPDVLKSVQFMTEALGMGLADRAQDIIAFTCARKDSDHHVVAFAKSPGVGFHHASFQVADPDEVGRGGRALLAKAGRGGWGFGRHTIGSNFFHYIQDPWGSWFEYFSDMDHIDDYSLWTPTNYGMEDSLASWGPAVPDDFVHNYEKDAEPYARGARASGSLMATITYIEFDGTEHPIDVPADWSVMEGAVQNGVPGIDAECGGACACATCTVYVDDAWRDRLPPPDDMEEGMLEDAERGPGARLSCQLKVSDALDGLVVRMPESQR